VEAGDVLMVEMRIIEKLRGQWLTDYEFTWDTTYQSILVRDYFNTNVRNSSNFPIMKWSVCRNGSGIYSCVGIAYSNGGTGSASCTMGNLTGPIWKDFIFPFRYSYKTVIDGVADGLITFDVNVSDPTSGLTIYYNITPYIYLIARDSSGNDRTLASVAMKTISGGFSTAFKKYYVPYFVEIDNQYIDYNEKLILRTYFNFNSGTYMVMATGGCAGMELRLYTTLNTDEIYINLPVVQ